ncbi:MAG TPA: cob(I)yrinic acid a,c-diamide adenosyltransferase [Spongiibacteraceae bacterium]|nr:cob(I)yrinic acid a,c-diamide adenosyltransferase [Spongiibacteraceae bacterium]
MGHRLSKIYTRTGDDGTTGLGDGSRIAKDHPRMQAIGSVDELNSLVGLLVAELPEQDALREALSAIQHNLFNLGGELSIPGYVMIKPEHIDALEQLLDELNEPLPPLKNFILPGGSRAAAVCHLARSVCRRAERDVVTLARETDININGQHYLNRLSDFLFVLARVLARRDGGHEILWQQPTP